MLCSVWGGHDAILSAFCLGEQWATGTNNLTDIVQAQQNYYCAKLIK